MASNPPRITSDECQPSNRSQFQIAFKLYAENICHFIKAPIEYLLKALTLSTGLGLIPRSNKISKLVRSNKYAKLQTLRIENHLMQCKRFVSELYKNRYNYLGLLKASKRLGKSFHSLRNGNYSSKCRKEAVGLPEKISFLRPLTTILNLAKTHNTFRSFLALT